MRAVALFSICIFALLSPPAAHASAVYNWIPGVSANQTFVGQLVISDAAYAAGGLAWSQSDYGNVATPGDMPLEQLFISGDLTATDLLGHPFMVNYVNGFDGSAHHPFYFAWDFMLQVVGNELIGSLSHNDTNSQIAMGRQLGDAYWQINRAGLDWVSVDRLCDQTDEPGSCAGLYGNWVLASAPSSNVLEPSSFWILFLAFPLLLLARQGLAGRMRSAYRFTAITI